MAVSVVPLGAPITHHQAPSNPYNANVHQKSTTTTSFQVPNSIPPPHTNQVMLSTRRTHHHHNFQTPFHGSPDSADYASAIESCDCLHLGRQIHSHALKKGYCGSPEFLQTKLLAMYGRCGSVDSARFLFEKMLIRNLYTWAGILTVYVDHGYFENALFLFLKLQGEEIDLEFFVFPILLKACSGLSASGLGRQLHGFVIKREFISNIYVGNALIDMYGKCETLDEAKVILKRMPERDCVSWNSMVTACAANGMVSEALEYLESMQLSGNLMPNLITWSAAIGGSAQNGYDEEALELLYQMQESGIQPNARTLASVLPACARLQTLSMGKEIHGYTLRHELMSNTFIAHGLVDVYRRCSDIGSASKIFSSFSERNLVSSNTMIVGYCQNGDVGMAKELFDQMELYGVKKDIISWNSMLSGYAHNREFDRAMELFRHMQLEEVGADSFTLGSALTVCADMAALQQGKEMHSFAITRGLSSNAFVGGALVEMYCRCQDLASARMVSDRINEKDTATWNALISGHARCNQMEHARELLSAMRTGGLEPNVCTWNGILAGYVENEHNESALQLFVEMQIAKVKSDIYTVGIILPACSRLTNIKRGKQLHTHLIRCGWDSDVRIGAALVDMYAKCGGIRHAELAFYRISQHNLVAYNTMLAGYAMHGLGKEGIAVFHRLLSDGIRPDAVTFLSVLSSCSHGGLIKQGCDYFNLMVSCDIKPELKHYTCMVDLLSRAGQLSEAYRIVQKMPVEPDAVVWGALLNGCVVHRNDKLGEVVANKLVELEGDAGNYGVLANLYASAGRQDDFARMRKIMNGKRMQKTQGCSWFRDRNRVHVFLAGDVSHEHTNEIYATVMSLNLHMKTE